MTNVTSLPLQLKSSGLFCVWRYEERDGKRTKVPYNPRTGGKAQPNNVSTFAPLPDALAVQCHYDGIGVGIFGDLCAIDIDHCVDKSGGLSDMAQDIIATMTSYTEFSPSSTGIRILFEASGFEYNKSRYFINNQSLGVEIYVAGATSKYVTVTGNTMLPDRNIEERSDELQVVLEKYMRRVKQEQSKQTTSTLHDLSEADTDTALIAKAQKAQNGAQFTALWNGDTGDYKSPSEADLALCSMLAFWTGCDSTRIDRLFRQSGLMREKWSRMQGGSAYGAITIQKAIQTCSNVYGHQVRALAGHEEAQSFTEKPDVRPADFSDAGNAAVFASIHKCDSIFVDALGWLSWDGCRWDRNEHAVSAKMIQLTRFMLDDAINVHVDAIRNATTDLKVAQAYLKHAQDSRNEPRIRRALLLARPSLHRKLNELDADPFSLCTPTCVVDLRTGHRRPHISTDFITKITEVSPDDVNAQQWLDFLSVITCGDDSLTGFLQMVAGMASIGAVYHEGVIIAYGGGRNGKSTFWNALSRVLGDYSGSIPIETLTTDKTNKGATLATVKGKRLILTGEMEEGKRLSASTLKKLASTDKLVAEEKYKQPEEFAQSHTLALFTNHLPRVGSTDQGTWRRMSIVPFQASIPASEAVQKYSDVLVENAGGAILSWIIEGAVNFTRNGFKLQIPDSVAIATEEYQASEDWLSNFINERCIKGDGKRIGARELYLAYKEWASECGDYVRRENDFSRALETTGYMKLTSSGRKFWIGLTVEHGYGYGAAGSG